MSETQDQYIRKYLHLFRGMIAEVQSKQRLLQDRLRKYPEQVEEIKLQLGGLEGEMDALGTTIEFIENWPVSCPMIESNQCSDCEHIMVCPIAKDKCNGLVKEPTVVVTSDGQVASNVPGVAVIEVDLQEGECEEEEVLAIDDLPCEAKSIIKQGECNESTP